MLHTVLKVIKGIIFHEFQMIKELQQNQKKL